MSLYERVPQIDLSPEFSDPPYSPFAARDYLRLLGDLFYFPQAVRDYVRGYARALRSECSPPRTRALGVWGAWLRDNPVQTDFLWMVTLLGVLLIFVVINAAGLVAASLASSAVPLGAMAWAMLLAIVSLFIMLAIGAVGDEVGALAPFALPAALALGLAWLAAAAAPTLDIGAGFAGVALLVIVAALAFGVAAAALCATASVGVNGIWTHAAVATVVALLLAVAVGVAVWPAAVETRRAGPLLGDLLGLVLLAALGYVAGALRVDDYLLHARYPGANPAPEDWLAIARVTPLPLPHLHGHMTAWLDFEWQQGMDNCVSLWWFTGQQASVRGAMHELLRGDQPVAAPPDPAIKLEVAADKQAARSLAMVARAADEPARYPFAMFSYAPTNLSDLLHSVLAGRGLRDAGAAVAASPSVQRRLKRQRLRQGAAQRGLVRPQPSQTPEQALVAGFWYLGRSSLPDALAAFRKVRPGPQSNEMITLVQTLHELGSQENLLSNAPRPLPQRPLKPFRPAAWQALDGVSEVVRFATLARQAVTPARRTVAAHRAMRELEALREPLPPVTAEVRYVQQLADLWAADLEDWMESATPPEPQGPVENPFLYAEPLRSGRMFVNRARELAALGQAWQSGNLQPVLLHGDPLIGKTSLLFAAERAMPSVELAWFHLGHTDRKRMALPQVLAAVEEAVRHTSVLELASFAPSRAAPAASLPTAGVDVYADAERIVRRGCALLQPRNMVLVFDDFDSAAASLRSEAALPAFLEFLAHLFQTITNFSIVFVYARPPEASAQQMTGAFAESLRTISLGPMGAAEVARLLRPPGFALYFDEGATATVVDATGGHPYLVQLLGNAVVERFNHQAAQRQGDSLICLDDVEAVLADPEFVRRAEGLLRLVAHISGSESSPPERTHMEQEVREPRQMTVRGE